MDSPMPVDTEHLIEGISPDDATEDELVLKITAAQTSYRTITVEPALILYTLYNALASPVQQQFLYLKIGQMMNATELNDTTLHCYANKSSPDYNKMEDVQSETSLYMIYMNICLIVPGFFSTIFIGGYSDRGGRKIGLILPVVGGILKLYILLCVMMYDLPIYFILISSLVEGLSGCYATFLMGAFSYISDVTSERQRSVRIIILEVCLGLAVTLSSLTSGYLIQYLNYMGTTLIIHILIVLTLFVIMFLPETRAFNEPVEIFRIDHFVHTFQVYLRDDGRGRRFILFMSVVTLLFVIPARLAGSDVQTLMMLNAPLCWSSIYIGLFRGLYYLITSVAGIIITKIGEPRWGDLVLVLIGCLCSTVHSIYWAFADTNLLMFLVPFVGLFSSLPIGMLRAFCSKIVDQNELGAMFAWIAWLELFGSLVGGVSFNAIYRATLPWFHGFVFIVMGLLTLCGAFVIICLMLWMRRKGISVREHQL